MSRYIKTSSGLLVLAFVLAAAGCVEEQTPRSYVQANAVEKALFSGEWYFRSCVIRVNYEAGQFTFPGDCSADYLNSGAGYVTPRIRWIIDQNFLYAVRAYEYVEGANPGTGSILGEPMAAFAIKSHFDIRRDYNPVTGEEYNILVENTDDNRWGERQFMRVDWSQNLITTTELNMASLYDLFDLYIREPAGFYVQDGTSTTGYEMPAEWKPKFVRTSAAEDLRDGVNRVGDYGGENVFYYMDFVTQEIFTPGMAGNPYTGENEPWCMSQVYIDAPICTSTLITIRNAFMKIPTNREYEPANWIDSRHERFGYWRLDRPTFDRSDPDNPADPIWGRTDFMNYNVGRFNLWERSYDAAGTPIPLRDRVLRPLHFYTTKEMPYHLLRTSLENIGTWNRHFMKTVRVARGQALPSWEDNPTYKFDPVTGDGFTCTGDFNIFGHCAETDRIYAGDPYGCRIRPSSTDAASPATMAPDPMFDPTVMYDTDFANDRFLATEGDECVLVTNVNSCVRHPAGRDGPDDPGEPCEERGDLRYSFVAYCDQPGTGFLGIAQMRSDPITGEFIGGDANIGGPALDGYRTRALTEWDLETGELTEEEYLMGEQSRQYMNNIHGNVDRPAIPQRENLDPGTIASLGFALPQLNRVMDSAMVRAEQLRGQAGRLNTYSHRVRSLIGTDIERLLFDHDDSLAAAGLQRIDPAASTAESRLDFASLFRTPLPDRMKETRHLEDKLSLGCVLRPSVVIDHSVSHVVQALREQFPGLTRPQLSFLINRHLYVETAIHEFGHVLGLRHNFEGTIDAHNFHSEYFGATDPNPWPDPMEYDANDDTILDTLELADLNVAQREVDRDRELAGSDIWSTSSLMDYTGQWYERLIGLGSYDEAAVYFGYADFVQVWDNALDLDPAEIRNDGRLRQVYWKFYNGGEACTTDADCPFSASGARAADLVDGQRTFGAVQRCVPVSTAYSGSVRACSNFWSDMHALNAAGNTDYVAREYRFCTDDRTGDMATCTRFDEGVTFREIVKNARDAWNRRYLTYAFRRWRSGFDYYTYLSGFQTYFMTAHKIFNDMFRRYAINENGYRTDTGPFGFYDQYMASVDTLNWYIETLAIPNVGSYIYRGWRDRYEYSNRNLDALGTQLNVPLGIGKYTYSLYQGGLDGINRLERIGTLYEKLWTMQLLLMRDWGYDYTLDEPYYVNFYDLFPNEILRLLTGLIADEPGYWMPRVVTAGRGGVETQIVFPNYWRGACQVNDDEDCWNVDHSLDALSPLESASFLVQLLGVSYALSEVPTFFDPSFQEQAQIYVVGSGGGARVPPGARECPLGVTTDCEYATFTSERFRRRYLAFKVEDDPRGVGGGSVAFAIVQKAGVLQADLHRLEQCLIDAGGALGGYCAPATLCDLAARNCSMPTADYSDMLSILRGEVDSYESFIRYMLETLGAYGINTWISYGSSM